VFVCSGDFAFSKLAKAACATSMWTVLSLFSVVLLAVAAWRDLATRTIPDTMVLALLLTGIILRSRNGFMTVGASLAIAMLLFMVLVALHARGLLGGGDVKLAVGVAAGLPPLAVPGFLMATGLAGLVLAILHLALRLLPPPSPATLPAGGLRRICRVERWRIARRGSLPYGIAIACGGAWAILAASGA
jgi:prepilin peptidase CpaA